jgi:hypothetical protein
MHWTVLIGLQYINHHNILILFRDLVSLTLGHGCEERGESASCLADASRARIFKRLWSPGIDSKE